MSDSQNAHLDFHDSDDEFAQDAFHNESLINEELLMPDPIEPSAKSSSGSQSAARRSVSGTPPPVGAPWSLSFYQPYFNVTQHDVLHRTLRAFLGPIKWDFFDFLASSEQPAWSYFGFAHQHASGTQLELDVDEDSPTANNETHQPAVAVGADLWGPFWLTFAAVVSLIIASNTVDLMDYSSLDDVKETWTNDFTTVTLGTGIVYSYAICMSLILWTFSKFLEVRLSLLDALCLYGYTNAVYIPFILLCILFSNYDLIRWICLALPALWTAAFIATNVAAKLNRDLASSTFRVYVIPIAAVLCVAHLLMAIFNKFFFF